MVSKLSQRRARRILVVEFNPYQILVLRVLRPAQGAPVVEAAAEFDREDSAGFEGWIAANHQGRKTWSAVICGLVPRQGIVLVENLQPRRLQEPHYLASLVQEQQKSQFLTATPFKVVAAQPWTLRAVSALDGTALPADGAPRPAVICGIANDELRDVQQCLIDQRVVPDRIEAGLLSLFGAVYGAMERRGDQGAVVVVVIHPGATAVYILGKKGVHTPNPVMHGFDSIVELARKQLGEKGDTEIRSQLQKADHAVLSQAAKLVGRIGRDLKPVIDSYEMETGQPAEEILCAGLPSDLAWVAEPLARVAGRALFDIDCNQWLPAVGLQAAEGLPAFGPHWLGALSLATNLGAPSGPKSRSDAGANRNDHRPWHVDCKLAGQISDRKVARRRVLAGTLVAAMLVFVGAISWWQIYATQTLREDTQLWERQMASSRKLFDELTAASATVKAQSAILERAYELMNTPYQLSEFILNLGRTIPARMRVDRIESNDARAAISGDMLEPAEEASRTLGRYMDDLRRDPSIGPLFSSIAITSLQRKTDADAVMFEITLRHR